MDDPVGALIGTILLGAGILIVFGAVKNKRIFGKDGIVPTALTTGSITDLTKIPKAFPMFGIKAPPDSATVNVPPVWILPRATTAAIANIATIDPDMGLLIKLQISRVDSDSTRTDMTQLSQLLVLADAKGLKSDTDTIRQYIRELTGESI